MTEALTIEAVTREAEFQRLRLGDHVEFSPQSCLIVRRPGMSCSLCRDACPAGVLSGSRWSIALDSEGCVSCGLCAAACPTGALKVEGCAPRPPAAATDRIVLECRRVADSDRDPNAAVVPCLGGLTTPDLIDLVAETDATIILADHGWCADCPVARRGDPWRSALDETRDILSAIDARLADSLAVERRNLPVGRAEPVMTALRPDKQVGRRDFLKRLVGTIEPRDAVAESRRAVTGRGLVTPLKRLRILDQIGVLAADLEQTIPASLMPAVKIAEGCELNGLCAAICPTGALRRDEDDGVRSLQFDAAGCIACGECQRVCPSKALSLWSAGGGTMPDGPMTLVERQTAMCASCGDSFVPAGDEQCCAFCQKSMNVMHEIASLKCGSTNGFGLMTAQAPEVLIEARVQGDERWARLI